MVSSIAVRLPAAIAALCLALAGTVSYLGYRSASAGLEQQALDKLRLGLDAHAERLQDELGSIAADLTLLRDSVLAREALAALGEGLQALPGDGPAQLRAWYIDANPHPAGQKDRLDRAGEASAYSQAHARFHPFFRALKDGRGYYDLFLIDAQGTVVYSVFKEPDFATNLADGPWARSGLGEAFRQAISAADAGPVFVDYAPYAPSNGAPAAFVAARMVDPQGAVLGVIALQMPNGRLNEIVNSVSGLGATGSLTLVGPDLATRNDARFPDGPRFLSPAPREDLARRALAGETGFAAAAASADGNPSMVAFRPLPLFGTSWAVLIEQDRAELLAGALALRRNMILTLAAAGLAAAGLGLILGRSIARPLGRIGQAMDRIKAGDFAAEVPFVRRRDEVGGIARNLAAFRDSLKAAQGAQRMTLFKGHAFEGSPAAMMLVDRDLRILDYNPALERLFAANLDAFRDRWPDLDPARLRGAELERLLQSPDLQLRLSDPANLPHEADIALGDLRLGLKIAPIHDELGAYIGCSLQWSDVRDARINQSIIDAIRRNQTMIEYTPDFRVKSVNDTFSRVYGWGAEVIGRSFSELFGPSEDTRIQTERLKSGLTVQRKVERPAKDGRRVWVEVSMTPIRDRSGRLDRIVEIGSDVTQMEEVRIAAEAERERRSAAQKQAVEELRRGLAALAGGDLTEALDTPFAAEFEALRGNFAAAQAQLNETLARLVGATGNINAGAVDISQAADDLSRRTENQAATLEQTAAALDELTASVRSATEGAASADQAVRSARENAEASGKVVLEAVQAMSEIEKSSEQISQIIGVIDDIAFQTNLLALNAGVEAARAGEAGRGFAVVASEVRSLAQRSSEAAKEIKALISASSGHVGRGVSLVGRTGTALRQIVESVGHIAELVSELAASSREQSTGLSEINAGVNQLDQVTQQNAAMVQQSTAASHSLKREAETLAALVAQFRIRPAGAAAPAATPAAAPRAAAPRPGPAGPAPVPAAAPARGPARAAPGLAAAAPAATGTGGWEDF